MIWAKLWEIEDQIREIKLENVETRKRITLLGVDDLRLDPLMPSQHGEDLYLWEYFGKRRKGFFVEIGAHDGVTFSNSYWLESVGWNGVLVEANPELAKKAIKNRPYSKVINAAVGRDDGEKKIILNIADEVDTLSFTHGTEYQLRRIRHAGSPLSAVEVKKVTAEELLNDIEVEIDVLSVDIEGAEMDFFSTFNFENVRPKMIVVEDNSGGKNLDLPDFLVKEGYKLVNRLGCNLCFVPAS